MPETEIADLPIGATHIAGSLTLVGSPDNLRKFGVPPGGAFDRESHALANLLVGNPPFAPALELVGTGEFVAKAAGTVAVVGAALNACWRVAAGQAFYVPASRLGMRSYVAFGRGPKRQLADLPSTIGTALVRITPGPQAHLFDLAACLSPVYRVTLKLDRVGVRLEGPAMPHSHELPSEPACPGAIQIVNAGEPIILGPDGPTIGGYPKIAVVIDADLDHIGQLAPRASVRFEVVSLAEANRLAEERRQRLARQEAQLRLSPLRGD